MIKSAKKKIVRKFIGVVLIVAGARAVLEGYAIKNVPYSYRGSTLDIIDYIAGKNLFRRKDSLM